MEGLINSWMEKGAFEGETVSLKKKKKDIAAVNLHARTFRFSVSSDTFLLSKAECFVISLLQLLVGQLDV